MKNVRLVLLAVFSCGVAGGCGGTAQTTADNDHVVRSRGIVGETIRLTGTYAADRKMSLTDVVSNCGCTSVTLSKYNLLPGDQVNVALEFDTAGKSASVHRLPVYGFTFEMTSHATLPVAFEVSLESDIVFDDRLFVLKNQGDGPGFLATVPVTSEEEIEAEDVEAIGLPDTCRFRWKQHGRGRHSETRWDSTACIEWTPGTESRAKINDEFTLRIHGYRGRDRDFRLRLRGEKIDGQFLVKQSGFIGLLSKKPKSLLLRLRPEIAGRLTDLHAEGPEWLTLTSQVVGDRIDVRISLDESIEVLPPIAGELALTLSCRIDDCPVSCSVPVLYTLAAEPAESRP